MKDNSQWLQQSVRTLNSIVVHPLNLYEKDYSLFGGETGVVISSFIANSLFGRVGLLANCFDFKKSN